MSDSYHDTVYYHGVSGTFFPVSLPHLPTTDGAIAMSMTMVMTVDDNWLDTYPSGGATFVPGNYSLPPDSLGQMGAIHTATYDYTLNRWTLSGDGIKITPSPFDPDGAKFDIVLSAGGAALGRPVSLALQMSTVIDETAIVDGSPPFGTSPPAAPSGVIITTIDTSGFGLHIVWTDNATTEDGFFLQYSSDGGSSWTGLTILEANVIAYDSLDRDTTVAYSFRVKAFNATGISDWAVGTYDPDGGGGPVTPSISPNNGPQNGGTEVTLVWADLAPGAVVTVDGITVTLDVDDKFVTPAHGVGTYNVVVTNPDTTTITFPFTYFSPPLVLPTNSRLSGGQLVTFLRTEKPDPSDGSEFVAGASIAFAGVSATDITFVNADIYTCKTPPHAAGFTDITLTNLDTRLLVMTLHNVFYYGFGVIAPTVRLSPTQIAHGPLPSNVTLEAEITGGLLTDYQWNQISGPETVTLLSPNALITTARFTTFTPGDYWFEFVLSHPTNLYPPVKERTKITINRLQPPLIILS